MDGVQAVKSQLIFAVLPLKEILVASSSPFIKQHASSCPPTFRTLSIEDKIERYLREFKITKVSFIFSLNNKSRKENKQQL